MAHIVDGPEGTDCGSQCKCKTTPAYQGIAGAVGTPVPWDQQKGYEYTPNATTSTTAGGWLPDYMNRYHVPKCENCGYCPCCGTSGKPAG